MKLMVNDNVTNLKYWEISLKLSNNDPYIKENMVELIAGDIMNNPQVDPKISTPHISERIVGYMVNNPP